MRSNEALALLIASGVQAEAVVRAAADQLDSDWRRYMDAASGPIPIGAAQKALERLEAISPYRALLGACVAVWDNPDESATEVVKIGGGS